MNSQTLDYTTRQMWDEEMAHNAKMFFEADRLDAQAYQIIESYSGDAATWARFLEAKKIADAQRTAAYRDWMRVRRAMRNK
ncbi:MULTISPECIES: hypothetical protein [Pseudomonas]|jgi:hypothetical protein|uniref:Uncharacterized protein n=1 Tax=Pseudomonas fluorescens TaxID=294 RepID=A0A4Y9TN01_PSEFL|nr:MULTISPECIES: hypothetical protein [Pseudomonas]CRM87109.1 hypothetical protein [Pseudomonas sp. 22 E 5]MCX9149952.1 hypothetical protein [Pseudomonas sp. TB1-B1]TFW44337.1 hypothetical protein E4T65_07555 [Pseudomonas fluorescens]TKJ57165.1 hypothetical protein PspCFBP13506_24295 [Pseudomonas sp. CFBP13506]CRL99722.1 hypothetical protein [Pseudomonas sp. 31 E 6]